MSAVESVDSAPQAAVEVYWPDGSVTLWRTGTPILDEDGVRPLSADDLADHLAGLASDGWIRPMDDTLGRWAATAPPAVIHAALLRLLSGLDRQEERGEADADG